MWTAKTVIRLGGCQTDVSLRWTHSDFVGFVTRRLIWIVWFYHLMCPKGNSDEPQHLFPLAYIFVDLIFSNQHPLSNKYTPPQTFYGRKFPTTITTVTWRHQNFLYLHKFCLKISCFFVHLFAPIIVLLEALHSGDKLKVINFVAPLFVTYLLMWSWFTGSALFKEITVLVLLHSAGTIGK